MRELGEQLAVRECGVVDLTALRGSPDTTGDPEARGLTPSRSAAVL